MLPRETELDLKRLNLFMDYSSEVYAWLLRRAIELSRWETIFGRWLEAVIERSSS